MGCLQWSCQRLYRMQPTIQITDTYARHGRSKLKLLAARPMPLARRQVPKWSKRNGCADINGTLWVEHVLWWLLSNGCHAIGPIDGGACGRAWASLSYAPTKNSTIQGCSLKRKVHQNWHRFVLKRRTKTYKTYKYAIFTPYLPDPTCVLGI